MGIIRKHKQERKGSASQSHTHSHAHNHRPILQTGNLNRAFTIGIVLNIIFVVVEFGAGVILDSVALISDAGHNLSDVISLALSLLAFRLARQKPTPRYTYGRKKSTVLVSFTNACLLLVAIGIIIVESIEKIRDPQPVPGGAIAWVAGVGIIINAFTAWLFLRHKDKDLNVKGAYLHMAADTLVSVGVLISGIVIGFTGWYILDPLIGLVIAGVILVSTWGLMRDSIRLSLDGVPRSLDPGKVHDLILSADPRIEGLHHLHIWPLSTTDNALTAHLVLNNLECSEQIKQRVKQLLRENDISHVTLEVELPGEKERCPGCID